MSFDILYTNCTLLSLISISILLISYFSWTRRRLYILSRQFRGSLALPLVGNSYIFLGKDEDILAKIGQYMKKFDGDDPYKIWMGPILTVFITNPNHVEKVMLSQNFSHKHAVYDMIKNFLGEGLVTASGPTYRQHKKVIVPMLNMNFTNSCYDVFKKYTDLCMEDLKSYCDNRTFDIEPVFHKCFAQTISKAILGKDLETENDYQFFQDAIDTYWIGFSRLARPWFHLDILYKRTMISKLEDAIRKRNSSYLQKVIEESRKRINSEQFPDGEMKPLIDNLAERIEEQPSLMDDKVFSDHMYTLFMASEDTLSITSSFLCVCLGMYPKYQEKLAQELREYFGDTPRDATLEDIGKLPYLDMCIKEILRVVPIAPIILRKVLEECEIDGWILAKNSSIVVPVFYIHRDKRYWENPEHFHPDHFLPEVESKRPAYTYLPFSAGTRGCIGKIFANVNLRIFMATFLQKYEVEADGKLPDIKLRMDVSTRPVNGYKVRIKERKWK